MQYNLFPNKHYRNVSFLFSPVIFISIEDNCATLIRKLIQEMDKYVFLVIR